MYEVPEVSDGALVDQEKVYSVLAAEITSLSLLPPTCAPGLPALLVQMLTTVVTFAVWELPLLTRTETTEPVAVAGNLDPTFLSFTTASPKTTSVDGANRSEERRVGKGCAGTGKSR